MLTWRGTRQSNYFFSEILCCVPCLEALGKEIYLFFKNSLASATPAGTRQKIIIIFKNSLSSAIHGALGKETNFFRIICRVCCLGH